MLVDHCGLPGVYGILCNVLNLIKLQVFENSAEYNAVRAVGLNTLMQEYFDSCNFGVSVLCCILTDAVYLILERQFLIIV